MTLCTIWIFQALLIWNDFFRCKNHLAELSCFQFVLKRRKPMTTSRAKRKFSAASSSICSSQSSCKKVPRRALWYDIKDTWAGSRIVIATFWQCVKHVATFVNLNWTKLKIITIYCIWKTECPRANACYMGSSARAEWPTFLPS